jgi:AraC-like DNA-binding protein
MRHLALTCKAGHDGHHFLCRYGIRNFWFPIIIRHCMFGLAFVQAEGTQRPRPARRKSSHAAALRIAIASRRTAVRGMTAAGFKQAARLLQLIYEHAQTSALADLRKQELTQAQEAVRELQKVTTHLREELNGLVPAFSRTAPRLQPETRAERTVHAAIDYIHQHYTECLTLGECADALDLTPAYLSGLFSRRVGLTFKTYVTDLRLEKARLLLSDPAGNISRIANALGYASENCFRLAFKKATGLSPTAWRETLRMQPLVNGI